MRFVPFSAFTIETTATVEVVRDRLAASLRAASKSAKPLFFGHVSAVAFELTRIIDYRNSFVPTQRGGFEATANGTRIRVRMMPNTVVIVVLAVWLAFWANMLLMGISQWVFALGDAEWLLAVVPLGPMLFGYGLSLVGFWWEAQASRDVLTSLLASDVSDSLPEAGTKL